MVKFEKRSELIRQFILDNVEHHPKDVASLAAKTFEISRQAVKTNMTKASCGTKSIACSWYYTEQTLYFCDPL